MTITIRPLHLTILGAFLAGILVAGGVVLGLSSDDDPQPDVPTAANLDVAPTPSPTPEPSATPEPTTQPEPTAEPSPEPATSLPTIRTCDEIRADPTYRSPEERAFFLDNCLGGSEPASSNPGDSSNQPLPSPPSNTATAAEAQYRGRAEASVKVFAVRVEQYYNTPSYGLTADILEFGAVVRRFALELDQLPPPPPRFEQVHYHLRSSLIAMADFTITFNNLDLENSAAVLTWLDDYFTNAEPMVAALEDYALVVGIDLPPGLIE